MKNLFCIILAGGIGSRFFPLSNKKKPKQFIDFFNENESLIQKTFNRVSEFIDKKNIYILTNEKYANLINEHLNKLPKKNILCEPIQKNTAASIALGSFTIYKKNKKAKILVCPSDHLINNHKGFKATCMEGFLFLNKNDEILTIGIKPTEAHTGYGYIKTKSNTKEKITAVKEFKEKPNKKTAKEFLKSENYLWNSGIFIFSAKNILQEYKLHQQEIYFAFKKIIENKKFELKKCFENIKNISFDYAILEKTKKISVIQTNIEWSDLGSYSSLFKEMKKFEFNNALNIKERKLINSKNNIIILPKRKKIILKGISNYIIVEKNNTLLIYPKDNDQEIGEL